MGTLPRTPEPMMVKRCSCKSHSNCFLLICSLVFSSLAISSTKGRQLRETLAGMNAISHRNIRLQLPFVKSEEDDTENEEYEDFPQEPTLLQASYWTPQLYKTKPRSEVDQSQVFKVPAKRYLGIEIPDYVSSPSKGSILQSIQNRMKAAG